MDLRAETKRQLQALPFQENQILSRDLPKDTVLKALQLRLSGAVQTTYASGTPVADAQAAFDNIIPRIDVIIDGSRVVKSVRPHMMRMQQLISTKILGTRRSSAAAAPALGNLPTVDGGFAFGTTGQYSTVVENITISFEMVFAQPGDEKKFGREMTWLNLKNASSAELKLTCAAFRKLQGDGNTAPVTYGNSTLLIDIFTVEQQDVPRETVFWDWKQTTKELTLSAETTDYGIDINRGNRVAGIALFVKDGAPGTATTATGRMPSNLAVTKLQFLLNGSQNVQSGTFQALQDEMRTRNGINAPMSSNTSILDGYVRMDFLRNGDIETAIDCRQGVVDNAQLFLSSGNATNVNYANPVSITIMTEEIVMPR